MSRGSLSICLTERVPCADLFHHPQFRTQLKAQLFNTPNGNLWHRVLGVVKASDNALTWAGVAPFLAATGVAELDLARCAGAIVTEAPLSPLPSRRGGVAPPPHRCPQAVRSSKTSFHFLRFHSITQQPTALEFYIPYIFWPTQENEIICEESPLRQSGPFWFETQCVSARSKHPPSPIDHR